MLNWVILDSKERGANYGIGTFVHGLARSIKSIPDVKLYIIEIGEPAYNELQIREIEGITYIHIPFFLGRTAILTDKVRNQEKFAARILDLVYFLFRDSDNTIIHVNYLYHYFIAKTFKQRIKCSVIFTCHLLMHDEIKKQEPVSDIEFPAYELFDLIIAVSHSVKEFLIKKKNIPAEKIKVIYNGLLMIQQGKDDNTLEIRNSLGISKDEKIILFTGRFDTIKGLEFLIPAFRKVVEELNNTRLLIAGDGDYARMIMLSKGIQGKITFLGHVSHHELINIYRIADIGVVPSLDESFGYVALEMISAGLPLVATRVGGLPEIVKYADNALVVDMLSDKSNKYGHIPDVPMMASYIVKLLTRTSQNEKSLQPDGNSRIVEVFSAEKMAMTYLKTIINVFNPITEYYG